MSSPALAEVRKNFSGYRVVLLTIQSADKSQRIKVGEYAGDTHRTPWVELAMPHLIDEVVTLKGVGDLRYLWELRQYLRTYQFETAIVMSDVCAPRRGRWMKRFLMRFLLGPVPVLGWRGSSDPVQLKRKGLLKHHVHGPLQFLSEMSPSKKYKDSDLLFDLRPGHDAIAWATEWLHENCICEGKRLVAIAPGSIQPHKRWPEASFRTLIEKLFSKYDDIFIVIVGTPKDHEIGERFAQLAPDRILNLAGKSNIAQSAALMARCTLVLGNDGGAMHLADAMGAKVISLVPGIEYPDSIEPWHNKDLAIRWPVECAPCYSFTSCPEGHNKCMNAIPVSLVFDKFTRIL